MGWINDLLPNYGKRVDGTNKGSGWQGEIAANNGNVMTELSIGVDFGNGQIEIPLIVPTTSPEELNIMSNGGEIPQSAYDKAVSHSLQRLRSGQSPFANDGGKGLF